MKEERIYDQGRRRGTRVVVRKLTKSSRQNHSLALAGQEPSAKESCVPFFFSYFLSIYCLFPSIFGLPLSLCSLHLRIQLQPFVSSSLIFSTHLIESSGSMFCSLFVLLNFIFALLSKMDEFVLFMF